MQSQLTCPLCNKQYKDDNLPRLLLMTGFTYCQKCIRSLIRSQENVKKGTKKITLTCPQDGTIIQLKSEDINTFPKNIALIKIIQTKKASLSFRDEQSSIDVSKIAKQDSLQQDDDANDLIIAMKQGSQVENETSDKIKLTKEPQYCLLHQKPLQIVCMPDLIRICVNCAIFGEHKGHQFRSLEEIQKQRNHYYNSILLIMEKKSNIQNQLSNKETYNGIIGILEKKKDNMKKQITEHYNQLKNSIKISQKNCLTKLDQIIAKTQLQFQNLLKIDNKILNKYIKWQKDSFNQLKVLQANVFEEKLKLLFSNTNSIKIINQGTQIVDQMQIQQQNLIPQVQSILESIGVIHQNTIYKNLEHFIHIQEQIKKNSNTAHSRQQQLQKHQNKQKQQQFESNPMEESLLDLEQDLSEVYIVKPQFSKTQDENFLAKVQEAFNLDKNEQKLNEKQRINHQHKKSISNAHKSNQLQILNEKPNKKKLSKIKLSEKYDKVLKGILSDTLENIDFTNAQLGDANLILICQFIKGSKAKSIKLIRNKLSDDGIKKIIPFFGNISNLNLSQNNLTDHIIDIFIENIGYLQSLKSLILSQNKIDERKHKIKIDKLRKLEITVSL